MSPPVHSESRTLTSFLFLSSSPSPSRLNFELSSRHPPSIRLSCPTVLLLLVIIPFLNRPILTEGAFEIERNARIRGVDETRGFHINPNFSPVNRSDPGARDSSAPYRKSRESRGVEYGTSESFPGDGQTGVRGRLINKRSIGLQARSLVSPRIENSSLYSKSRESRGTEYGPSESVPGDGPTEVKGRLIGSRTGASHSILVLSEENPAPLSRTERSIDLQARSLVSPRIENSSLYSKSRESRGSEYGPSESVPGDGPTGVKGRLIGSRTGASHSILVLSEENPAPLSRTERSIDLQARSLVSPRIENSSLYSKSRESRGTEYGPSESVPGDGPTEVKGRLIGSRSGASPSILVLSEENPAPLSRTERSIDLQARSLVSPRIENSSLYSKSRESRGTEYGPAESVPGDGPTEVKGRLIGSRSGASPSILVLSEENPASLSRTERSIDLLARSLVSPRIENSSLYSKSRESRSTEYGPSESVPGDGPTGVKGRLIGSRSGASPSILVLSEENPAPLSRTERSIDLHARSLVSPRIENSSLGVSAKFDGPIVEFDSDGDGSVSPTKFPVRVTYKPAAPPGAGTPIEKYDRRHFGPPRLENLEEISKATLEVAGSSPTFDTNTHDDGAFPSPVASSPTPSYSSPTLLTDLPNSSGDFADGPREANHNLDHRREQHSLESLGEREEELDRDSEPSDNEGSARVARPDESTFGKHSTTPDYFAMRQSPSAIPDSYDVGTRIDGLATVESYPAYRTNADSYDAVDKLELTILGLFELTRGTEARPEGPSELQAARLAVDRINEMDVLPKIKLRLIHNDTRCDPGVAVDRYFHALYTSKNTSIMPLLLGTACSEVTETLAKIVPYWNIVQVSFGSTAPALSDPTEFPLFVRTVAPDSSHNPARISLIKHFGWDTVTALSQNGDMYSLAVNDLVTELEQANITCTATITFGENDYKEQLRTLKELDTRIIIGSFSPSLAPRLFCEAWKLGMHGGDYAWILPGETIDLSGMTGDWWHSGPEDDCSPSQLSQTLDGLIIVKSYGAGLTEQASYSGLTTAEFTSELAKRGVTLSRYAGQTYDAVWSMALALGKLEELLNQRNSSIGQYSHSRRDMAYHLLGQLKNLNFLGVSGPVSFDGADRVGITAFYQMHGHVVRRIAVYTPDNGRLTMNCPGCARIRWPGEIPPVARRVFRFRMVTIDYAAFLAVTCVASIGVTLALAFLAFNLHFRRHKSIKLSSPRLNNMAAAGCALVYGAVILLGLDHATLADSDGYFPTICTARAYLLSAGFSLAFGSMFTKTYRVHRIFTRSRSGVVKNKLLQDTQLISLICVLLLIDVLVVTLWVTLDPMQRDLRNLTLEISSQDRAVIYQPQVEVCRSQHTNGWLAALYTYKGLLLIVGVYMAWETRHVKIPALNDSQYIGMSVYSVVITSGIVVVLANLMSDRATLAFVTITTLILASTTGTLALLFLPQLANILAGERADPVVQSLGLKIECNTRRFVTDDSRELQYRVEVQNRVYRREMAQLELELARLEKQLGQEPVEPSQASSSASPPQRNPSIGGGLPLLLLSVLPPVIPRASWPSADPSGMRRGTVAFSSQPDLEPDGTGRSLADIYKLGWRRDTEGPNRLGVFQRLFSLFGSRPNSRKTSTASFTGVASALRVHMGYIAGLVPGTKASSSCQVNVQGVRPPHPRCGSGPIISITSEEDRRLSLGLRRKESSEPRVNFSLPFKANTSESSSRERIRGSPRFPHRIVMADSLSAITPGSIRAAHHRWHSMEDASRQKIVSYPHRGSSCNPICDLWAVHGKGIPLSELPNFGRGSRAPEIAAADPPSIVPADHDASPDDALLGSDLRKLFRENSATCDDGGDNANSPDDDSRKYNIVPSPCSSPIKLPSTVTHRTETSHERTNTNDSPEDVETRRAEIVVEDLSINSELDLNEIPVTVGNDLRTIDGGEGV